MDYLRREIQEFWLVTHKGVSMQQASKDFGFNYTRLYAYIHKENRRAPKEDFWKIFRAMEHYGYAPSLAGLLSYYDLIEK